MGYYLISKKMQKRILNVALAGVGGFAGLSHGLWLRHRSITDGNDLGLQFVESVNSLTNQALKKASAAGLPSLGSLKKGGQPTNKNISQRQEEQPEGGVAQQELSERARIEKAGLIASAAVQELQKGGRPAEGS